MPSARLTIIGSEGEQEDRVFSDHAKLGRHPANNVQILDRIVSKEHAHIDYVDGAWVLRDLGSLNGTLVNGEKVGTKVLREGDELTLGTTRVVFHPLDAPEGTRQSKVPGPGGMSRVTIAPGVVESHIRSKLAPVLDHSFLPEGLVHDAAALRRDYEKLRVSYEVIRAIGVELDVDKLLAKIIDCAFQLLPADRGVVLLYDYGPDGKGVPHLSPRCVRTRKGQSGGDDVVLSTTIINEVLRDKAAVLSSDATVDSRFQTAHSVIMQGIRSTMAVPLLHSGELFGIMVLDSQIATSAFTEKDLQLFQNVANQAAIAVQNSLYARRLEDAAITRGRIQRLLSPAIAEEVLSGKVEITKSGELRETTILFTDIRGFTAMSEKRSARDIVDMLNEYFELMVEIIFKYEGTLDKFVGDEIMALFGSPVAHPDDPFRAVATALEMMQVLEEFNRTRMSEGEEALHIGIGINTGEVVAGYLGSSRALEYTVIGDSVNIGARLCSAAGPGQIIISESTYQRVRDRVEVVELPATHVKGKSHPLGIYNVLRARSSNPVFRQTAVAG